MPVWVGNCVWSPARIVRAALPWVLFGVGLAWLVAGVGVSASGLPPVGLGVVLVAGQSLTLIAAFRRPLFVFVVVLIAAGCYGAMGYPGGPIELGELTALFVVASIQSGWIVAGATAAAAIGIAIVALTSPDWTGGPIGVFAVLVVFVLVATAGTHQRHRHLGMRAATARVAEVEQARAERDVLAAVEERLRLSQELHDMIGHTLAVILLQAGLARRALDDDPGRVRRALVMIEDRGSTAMLEMQRLLGVLADTADNVAALPVLADIGRLTAEVRAAGVEIIVSTEGALSELPVAVDLAGYRIVQESLTNVLRHARASCAWVQIHGCPQSLEITVIDDGRGWLEGTEGRGITGMRGRVSRLGGELLLGNGPRGGLEVRARLPLRPTERPTTSERR